MTSYEQNTSRVEIIIKISIENRMKSTKNFGHVLRAIFYTYRYYNFNPSGIFAHMTSFSVIRNQALEQGGKFSKIKVQKNATSNVRNGLKLGKICKKVSHIVHENVKK